MKAKMILSLTIVCLVAAGLLSWVYSITTPKIAEAKKEKLQEQLKEVFPEAATFGPLMKDTIIEGKTVKDTILPDTLWIAYDTLNEKLGIVFKVFPRGYGGPIETLVGLKMDTTVNHIRPVTPGEGLKETPGLGVRVTEKWFKKQFSGKKEKEVLLKKDGGTIDAITSATISSRAVTNGIRKGIEKYKKYLKL